MNWSFRVARAFGIDIKVHITFFLILFIGAMQFSTFGAPGMLFGVLVIVLLFVCVTLHELGHSVVAMRFGISVKDIVLLPIGGVASLGRMPTNPRQELLIALAGPAVNVVIAAVLWLVLHTVPAFNDVVSGRLLVIAREGPSLGYLLSILFTANVMLVLFNMIPAFPMDGGRVFRAILAFFIPHGRATGIAAVVGQFCALGMAVVGLYSGQLILIVIAIFIFMAAGAENAATQAKTVLVTKRVGDCYNRTAITLSENDRVSDVVNHLLTSYQSDFAVTRRGELVGVMTREDVLRYLSTNNYDVYVTEVLKPDVIHVDANQTLDEVRDTLTEKGVRLSAVFEGDHYLGLVSHEDISEAYTVLQFVNRSQERRGQGEIATA